MSAARSLIETADRRSRLRAALFMAMTVMFIIVQLLARGPFEKLSPGESHWRPFAWVINAAILLLCLATGGGLLTNPKIRALVNDEVSRTHGRTASIIGFWTAMATGLVLYVIPASGQMTGRQATYVIVAPATAVALLVFSWLETRAHADA